MTKHTKNKTVKRFVALASCATAAITGTFFASNFLKTVDTSAITANGDPVTLTYKPIAPDGVDVATIWPSINGYWHTPFFTATTADGVNHTAYCLNPHTPAPESGSTLNSEVMEDNQNNTLIKLALAIADTAQENNATTKPIYENWFSSVPTDWYEDNADIGNYNSQFSHQQVDYSMIHAIVGALNTGQTLTEDYPEDDVAAMQNWIDTVTASLKSLASDNADIMDIAQGYQLYHIDPDDLGDAQDIAWVEKIPYSIDTSAVDGADGDKTIAPTQSAKIVDTINYCALKGKKYTIQGVLMDKETGLPLMVGNSTVQNQIEVTPTSDCDTTTMEFVFDASALAGKSIVVFETLLSNNIPVATHSDINDPAQTISVSVPQKAPDSGFITNDESGNKEGKVILPIVITAVAAIFVTIFAAIRLTAKRNFFGKK